MTSSSLVDANATAICPEPAMPHFQLVRTGDVDLEFDGVLLAEQDTRDDPAQERWAELRIWRTDSGKYVTQRIGRSVRPNEVDKIVTRVCNEPEAVRAALLSKQGDATFMSNLALDTLTDAIERDPALAAAATERI